MDFVILKVRSLFSFCSVRGSAAYVQQLCVAATYKEIYFFLFRIYFLDDIYSQFLFLKPPYTVLQCNKPIRRLY